MWFIQSPVEALALPTDSVGRTTLTGNVSPWFHLVRDSAFTPDERAAISAMPVRWSVWSWQQTGRRVQLHDTIAVHKPLIEMVRADPMRACVFAKFPLPGKRLADNTIEVVVVVPPATFDRYEALVRFAMGLPSGHISLTVRSPIASGSSSTESILVACDNLASGDAACGNAVSSNTARADDSRALIIEPGMYSVTDGLEMVVARGPSEELSKADLRTERRSAPMMHSPANLVHDDGDDWLLFAADRPATVDELEDAIGG